METEIEYLGVKLDINYTVNGSYMPETRYDPTEYAEIIISDVLVGGISIIDILLETQLDDIDEILNNKLEL